MPVLFAPIAAALLGLLVAYYGRAELTRGDRALASTHTFRVSVWLAGLVLAPTLSYFAAFHGDWAYLYLVPEARVPSAVDLLFVVGAASICPAMVGFAARRLAEKRAATLLRVAGALLAFAALAFALTHGRLSVSASYAQFRGGFGATPIGSSPLGRGVVLAWLAVGGAVAWARASLGSTEAR